MEYQKINTLFKRDVKNVIIPSHLCFLLFRSLLYRRARS
nr:MAG TPA: hypothetical protein [Caudoviricetes sp.]